jgi:hypothetical protein
MGTSLPFRPATFDDCISISALQWLSYSNKRDEFPKKRLMRFFSVLFVVLRRGARAVLQLFPKYGRARHTQRMRGEGGGIRGGVRGRLSKLDKCKEALPGIFV